MATNGTNGSASKRLKVMKDSVSAGWKFPFDLDSYRHVDIDPFVVESLTPKMKEDLQYNIDLCRDAIVFFTACGSASGQGGHTGGAFDTVPEVCILDSMFQTRPDKFVNTFFDEAGHRVATQYLFAAINGHIEPEHLINYRKAGSFLPGHPELGHTPGVKFSSGRLGHMWPAVNGVAIGNPGKATYCLGSDGSQMEGNDAEAARLAVAENLSVKLLIDDNDVTITGHPSQYCKGYSVAKTLEGHGLKVQIVNPEDTDALYAGIRASALHNGPFALVCQRKMCPGIPGVEGDPHGHDAVAPAKAIPYLESRGAHKAVEFLKSVTKTKHSYTFESCGPADSLRQTVGKALVEVLDEMSPEDRKAKVMVIDSDLGGSTAMTKVQAAHPEVYIQAGIMERGNFSAAAGFGMEKGKQGVFSTFAAFLEMCVSEITMARLNKSNVFAHFSHSGVDDMADNTCHYGINNMIADTGLDDGYETKLYFCCDSLQIRKCVKKVFHMPGLRFVFSTRSKVPALLKENGEEFYGDGYEFVPGKDDLIRDGKDGFIVAFGDAAYRSLDAVTKLKREGIDVGLVGKATLNVVDEDMMAKIGKAKFVLVVEPLNRRSGLGSRFGTWLLERGLTPKYKHIGTHLEGHGGLWEHAYHQGYDSASIIKAVKSLV